MIIGKWRERVGVAILQSVVNLRKLRSVNLSMWSVGSGGRWQGIAGNDHLRLKSFQSMGRSVYEVV